MTDAGDVPSLPDHLGPGLSIVFVGINPSVYAVQRGHYFARRTNRFWPALSRSRLSAPIRAALQRDALTPDDDVSLLQFGIGFTDVVKRPTRNASELNRHDFQAGVPALMRRIEQFQPAVACFQGMMGFRPFAQVSWPDHIEGFELGAQTVTMGRTRVYVVPSPSPANAHYRLDDQIAWFDRLADFLETCVP